MNQHPPIFYNILSHFVYRQRKAVLHSGWPQYVLCTKPNQQSWSATHNKLCSPMPMFYVKYSSSVKYRYSKLCCQCILYNPTYTQLILLHSKKQLLKNFVHTCMSCTMYVHILYNPTYIPGY